MKIIGLTGGIAAGKNFVSEIFSKEGAWIFDADKESHKILEENQEIILLVIEKFPQAAQNNKICREILGKIVFGDAKNLKILEEIIYPNVRKNYQEFLKKAKNEGAEMLVLNVPLLLEKQGYEYDFLVVVVADLKLRNERFIKRELAKRPREVFELEQKFSRIIARQMSDEDRTKNADFVINCNESEEDIIARTREIILAIKQKL